MYRLRRMYLCFEGMLSRWIEIEIIMYQFLNQHITDVSSYNILVWGRSANQQSGFKRVEFRHKRVFLTSLTFSNSWDKVTNNWHSKQSKRDYKGHLVGSQSFFVGTVQHKAKTNAERMRPSTAPQTDSSCSPPLMRIRWGTWYTTTAHPHTGTTQKDLHLMPVVGKDLNNTFKISHEL